MSYSNLAELGGQHEYTMPSGGGGGADGLQFFPNPNSYDMSGGPFEGNYGDPSIPQGQRYITPNSNGAPTGGFEDEPPLLEELGINLSHIRMKTLSVLNPFSSVSADIIGDSDLAGPLMFCMALGSFLLLVLLSIFLSTSYSKRVSRRARFILDTSTELELVAVWPST